VSLHISLLCLQSCPSFAFICTDDTGALQRFCRVHPLNAGRLEQTCCHEASASWLHEREREREGEGGREREKRETETGVWLTLLPIRRWPLWSEPFPWETSLPASRSNWMPFLFCRAPFFVCRRRALKYNGFNAEALCLFLMLIEIDTFYIADMLLLLKLIIKFAPVLLNEGGWLIKVPRFEIGPNLRACISCAAFILCVWRAFSITDLWIHFVK